MIDAPQVGKSHGETFGLFFESQENIMSRPLNNGPAVLENTQGDEQRYRRW